MNAHVTYAYCFAPSHTHMDKDRCTHRSECWVYILNIWPSFIYGLHSLNINMYIRVDAHRFTLTSMHSETNARLHTLGARERVHGAAPAPALAGRVAGRCRWSLRLLAAAAAGVGSPGPVSRVSAIVSPAQMYWPRQIACRNSVRSGHGAQTSCQLKGTVVEKYKI